MPGLKQKLVANLEKKKRIRELLENNNIPLRHVWDTQRLYAKYAEIFVDMLNPDINKLDKTDTDLLESFFMELLVKAKNQTEIINKKFKECNNG